MELWTLNDCCVFWVYPGNCRVLLYSIHAGAGSGKAGVYFADHKAAVPADSAALPHLKRLRGAKPAHPGAGLLAAAGPRLAGTHRGASAVTAADKYAVH